MSKLSSMFSAATGHSLTTAVEVVQTGLAAKNSMTQARYTVVIVAGVLAAVMVLKKLK